MTNPKEDPERWLTAKQVAEMLGVSLFTVYRYAATGRLTCVRLTRRTLRFRPEDIETYLRRHTTGKKREQKSSIFFSRREKQRSCNRRKGQRSYASPESA